MRSNINGLAYRIGYPYHDKTSRMLTRTLLNCSEAGYSPKRTRILTVFLAGTTKIASLSSQFRDKKIQHNLHPRRQSLARRHQQHDGREIELPCIQHPRQLALSHGVFDIPLRAQYEAQPLLGPVTGGAAVVADETRMDAQGFACSEFAYSHGRVIPRGCFRAPEVFLVLLIQLAPKMPQADVFVVLPYANTGMFEQIARTLGDAVFLEINRTGAHPALVFGNGAGDPGGVSHAADMDHDVGVVPVRPGRFAQVKLQFQLRMQARQPGHQRRDALATVAEWGSNLQAAGQMLAAALKHVGQLFDPCQQDGGLLRQ